MTVYVEKGMNEGQIVKFRGQADQEYEKEPGDVVIVLVVKDHDRFTRKGPGMYIRPCPKIHFWKLRKKFNF